MNENVTSHHNHKKKKTMLQYKNKAPTKCSVVSDLSLRKIVIICITLSGHFVFLKSRYFIFIGNLTFFCIFFSSCDT